MTTLNEKELLEVEKLKVAVKNMINDSSSEDLKVKYEAWRLVFYGVAVGFAGTFAIAKTISLLNC